jgi:ketosteroid isomerase-like protein
MTDRSREAAIETVRHFLRLVEARDLEQAGSFLADDAQITFPGGRVFTTLQEQVASSAGRFRGVHKTFDRFDVAPAGDDDVVYVSGTLSGEDVRGAAFAGVRYIDRFTIRAGKIVSQMVWNDLAERGVVPPSARS